LPCRSIDRAEHRTLGDAGPRQPSLHRLDGLRLVDADILALPFLVDLRTTDGDPQAVTLERQVTDLQRDDLTGPESARQQVETARLEGVALNFGDVEQYLSDLWASIDKEEQEAEDGQEDCGRAY
jgi:hypothetical protein